MPKDEFKFDIIYKKAKEIQKDLSYPSYSEEEEKYNEIRELSEIVSEIQEPETRYLTST